MATTVLLACPPSAQPNVHPFTWGSGTLAKECSLVRRREHHSMHRCVGDNFACEIVFCVCVSILIKRTLESKPVALREVICQSPFCLIRTMVYARTYAFVHDILQRLRTCRYTGLDRFGASVQRCATRKVMKCIATICWQCI